MSVSKTSKMLTYINYSALPHSCRRRQWRPPHPVACKRSHCDIHASVRRRMTAIEFHHLLCAGMRVTITDGRQIVGRCEDDTPPSLLPPQPPVRRGRHDTTVRALPAPYAAAHGSEPHARAGSWRSTGT